MTVTVTDAYARRTEHAEQRRSGGTTVRTVVRKVVRLLVVSAVVGTLVRAARARWGPATPTAPTDGGVRTGSFDTWPAVPAAPGRI
ncbi:MAG: hypothetical protein ACRDY1_08465, partial [Acidimicrobiales bacterium]